jgi:hypothetical protein
MDDEYINSIWMLGQSSDSVDAIREYLGSLIYKLTSGAGSAYGTESLKVNAKVSMIKENIQKTLVFLELALRPLLPTIELKMPDRLRLQDLLCSDTSKFDSMDISSIIMRAFGYSFANDNKMVNYIFTDMVCPYTSALKGNLKKMASYDEFYKNRIRLFFRRWVRSGYVNLTYMDSGSKLSPYDRLEMQTSAIRQASSLVGLKYAAAVESIGHYLYYCASKLPGFLDFGAAYYSRRPEEWSRILATAGRWKMIEEWTGTASLLTPHTVETPVGPSIYWPMAHSIWSILPQMTGYSNTLKSMLLPTKSPKVDTIHLFSNGAGVSAVQTNGDKTHKAGSPGLQDLYGNLILMISHLALMTDRLELKLSQDADIDYNAAMLATGVSGMLNDNSSFKSPWEPQIAVHSGGGCTDPIGIEDLGYSTLLPFELGNGRSMPVWAGKPTTREVEHPSILLAEANETLVKSASMNRIMGRSLIKGGSDFKVPNWGVIKLALVNRDSELRKMRYRIDPLDLLDNDMDLGEGTTAIGIKDERTFSQLLLGSESWDGDYKKDLSALLSHIFDGLTKDEIDQEFSDDSSLMIWKTPYEAVDHARLPLLAYGVEDIMDREGHLRPGLVFGHHLINNKDGYLVRFYSDTAIKVAQSELALFITKDAALPTLSSELKFEPVTIESTLANLWA